MAYILTEIISLFVVSNFWTL